MTMSNNPAVTLSIQITNLLIPLAPKAKEHLEEIENQISNYKYAELTLLKKDREKIAFWINVYTSIYILYLAKSKNPQKLPNRSLFYILTKIQVGHTQVSMYDIKEGILRLNRTKKAPNRCFQRVAFSAKDARLALLPQKLEHRIHFALCFQLETSSPLTYYTDTHLDFELGEAERTYSIRNFIYDLEFQRVAHTRLYLTYKYDFPNIYLSDPQFYNFKLTEIRVNSN